MHFEQYVHSLGLGEEVSLEFSEKALVRTSVIHNNKTNRSKIVIRQPINYSLLNIRGVLHH
jgi:hypothetical protein